MVLETDALRAAFAKFDANSDGTITREELTAILTRPTPERQPLKKEEADAIFDKADVNGDGRLDYEEFVRAWSKESTS